MILRTNLRRLGAFGSFGLKSTSSTAPNYNFLFFSTEENPHKHQHRISFMDDKFSDGAIETEFPETEFKKGEKRSERSKIHHSDKFVDCDFADQQDRSHEGEHHHRHSFEDEYTSCGDVEDFKSKPRPRKKSSSRSSSKVHSAENAFDCDFADKQEI